MSGQFQAAVILPHGEKPEVPIAEKTGRRGLPSQSGCSSKKEWQYCNFGIIMLSRYLKNRYE
jgi:hypothetical protein